MRKKYTCVQEQKGSKFKFMVQNADIISFVTDAWFHGEAPDFYRGKAM